MINGKSIEQPQMADLLESKKREIFSTLNAVKIGEIVSFDSDKRTASVQIAFKRVLKDGTAASYKVLLDCPVFTLKGGTTGFVAPIASGDECIVLFSDANIDAWFSAGGEAIPYDQRSHDLSDGIALVGLNSLAKPLALTIEDGEIGMSDALARVAVKNGLVTIQNATTSLLLLMVNFITLLESATVLDDEGGNILPLTPAFIASLEAYKAQFEALLY